MRRMFFFKPGFTLSLRVALLFLAGVPGSWAMKPLGSAGAERECEEREGGDAKRQKTEFGSRQKEIQLAIDESSAQKLLLLYESLKETNLSPYRWKEEWVTYVERTQRKNAVLWNTGALEDYGMNLRGLVFLEAAVNEPHMQLIKNILLPLKGASDETWDEEYKQCVEKLGILMGRHHYFRRTGGLYGLIAASGFKNPIASLIFLTAFRSVWEESINVDAWSAMKLSDRNEAWFKSSHERVSGGLKDQKESLRLFLSDVDLRYVDLSEEICKKSKSWVDTESEEREQRAIFGEKRQLGLPYYSIVYGECIGGHLKDTRPVESVLGRIACYAEALDRGDPRGGYLYASAVNGRFEELPEEIRKWGLTKRTASIKMGDPKAIALWKSRLSWVWKTPKEQNWATNLIKTYAIHYRKMRQYFERVQ